MKILIITFTSGNNPGTFMQSLGVQTAMKKMYPNAKIDFLRFPDFKVNFSVRDKNAKLWQTIHQKAASAYRLVKYNNLRRRFVTYTSSVDLFNYTAKEKEIIYQYDLVVIGSDTILEKAYGSNGCIGLNWMPLNVRKIYFAASASPANFEPNEELKNVASDAEFIGLRDKLTIDFFVNKLGISEDRIIKQPDPSYFLDINQFKLSVRQRNKLKKGKRYVLYNFMSNFPLRKELADALRKIGYYVVSTSYNPYADICLDTIDAYDWAGVFELMDIIVTERFHDSVFGLRNERPVVAIDWDPVRFTRSGDSKTLRILEDYGHMHLHFNLCNTIEISPVISAIENIGNLYDLQKVRNVNIYQQKLIDSILEQIKRNIKISDK